MKTIYLLLALSFTGPVSWSQKDTTAYTVFSAAALQQDLDSMYLQLQLNHPSPFAHIRKKSADEAFQKARKQIRRPMNRLEFTRIAAPFVALFRDGHTYVETDFEGEDFQQYTQGGGRFFPLAVYIIGGKLYAGKTALALTGIQRGDEIISLNGVKSSQIIRQLKDFWSADGEQNAIATAQRLFSYSLWAVYNWGNESKVEYLQGGIKRNEQLTGIGKDDFLKLTFNIGGNIRQLHLYPAYSLAVLEINSYGNLEKSNRFIDSSFGVIKKMGIKNVALDLRKNGGGNSYIGDYFLAHLNKKPYSTVSTKTWHVSPMVLQLSADHWIRSTIEEVRKTYTANGNFLESPKVSAQSAAALADSSLFVDASLYLFTSPQTYSSAHMTALAIKCGGLGTIIGRPTGERLDLTGEVLEYKAPNSGVKLAIPIAAYKTACGDGAQVGVQPDHLIETSIHDIKTGRDPELEYLKKLLKGAE